MPAAAPLTVAQQSIHFLTRTHVGMPEVAVPGARAWFADDLRRQSELWLDTIPTDVLSRFEAHVDGLDDHALLSQSAEDLAVPGLDQLVNDLRRRLRDGPGFALLRGVPVDVWSPGTTRHFLWAIAQLLGIPGMQNPRGDVIGEVRDTAADDLDPLARNYMTNKEFRFHCDAADIVGLLCVRPANSGGRSKVASSVTVFNELRRIRPDLAARLFEPILLDARNEQSPGMPPYAPVVPLAYDGSTLRTFYISDYFRSVDRFPDVEIDEQTRDLLDIYEAIAGREDICLQFDLQPGDFEVLNNHTMLHAREPFVDEHPDATRLLLRVLVSAEDLR